MKTCPEYDVKCIHDIYTQTYGHGQMCWSHSAKKKKKPQFSFKYHETNK